jgi:hypothetical protein
MRDFEAVSAVRGVTATVALMILLQVRSTHRRALAHSS